MKELSEIPLKNKLQKIAENVNENTSVEDVFEQLMLMIDIEDSENQIKAGDVYSHDQIKEDAKTWLK